MINHRDLILGELREFRHATKEWQKGVDKKLESFGAFKMKLLGAAGLASFIATLVIEFLKK